MFNALLVQLKERESVKYEVISALLCVRKYVEAKLMMASLFQ